MSHAGTEGSWDANHEGHGGGDDGAAKGGEFEK
jgi:hypothetical protein